MKKLIVLSVLLFSGSLFAQTKTIGPAGCGLGNMLMGGEGNQIIAATTNGSFYSQPFGITSGTSNCEQSQPIVRLENFIESNRMVVESDAARGQGESLVSIAQILRCPSAEKVGQSLKSEHERIFTPEATSAEVTQEVRNILMNNGILCLSLG